MTDHAPPGFLTRAARDDDGDQLIALIDACFAEYPNCILDVDGEAPELRTIASYTIAHGGCFWVAERDSRVVGSVGIVAAADPTRMELKKLYVAKEARRRGLASHLCDLAEAEARNRGAAVIELWSDTRFADAHRLYARRGYVGGVETRALHDVSNSVEYHFRKTLP